MTPTAATVGTLMGHHTARWPLTPQGWNGHSGAQAYRPAITRLVNNGLRQRVLGHFPGFDGSQLKSQVEGLHSILQAPTQVPPGDSIPARQHGALLIDSTDDHKWERYGCK